MSFFIYPDGIGDITAGGLDEWLETLEGLIDENIAATLTNKVLNLESEMLSKANQDDLGSLEASLADFKNNIEAVKYENDKLFLRVDGEWVEYKQGGRYNIGNVANIKVSEDDARLILTWQDPPDVTVEDDIGNPIVIVKWSGTMVVINDTAFPVNENDGDLLVDNKVRNQYKDEGLLIDGLENDTTYYIGLFPYTEEGVVTVDNANRIEGTPTEIDPDSWRGIQKIVRQGLASEFFEVGDEIATEYDGGEIIWQVIGIDVDTPADPSLTHSMTLQTKDCLHDIQFDAPEPNNPDGNRKTYGSNRYTHSAVKQWLNSDESKFNWQSQHQHDAKPTSALDLYDGAGFLHRLDPELVEVLGPVKKKVAKNTVTDGGGQEEFNAEVFLLSQLEVDLGTEGTTTGEFVYPFYDGKGNANRIKNLNDSPRIWWLRSPYVSYSDGVRCVSTGGPLGNGGYARNSHGLSPACTIV